MLTVTKEFTWDMAHMLAKHEGLCKNLHGHTYKMLVEVTNPNHLEKKGPAEGMVIDFKALKRIVNELIVKPLDHCVMLDMASSEEFELALLSLCQTFGKKVEIVNYRPTAENMAESFFKTLSVNLMDQLFLKLISITLYETPTSFAKVVAEGAQYE